MIRGEVEIVDLHHDLARAFQIWSRTFLQLSLTKIYSMRMKIVPDSN